MSFDHPVHAQQDHVRKLDPDPKRWMEALEKAAWNVTRAANLLGVSRDTLRYGVEKYNLSEPQK